MVFSNRGKSLLGKSIFPNGNENSNLVIIVISGFVSFKDEVWDILLYDETDGWC